MRKVLKFDVETRLYNLSYFGYNLMSTSQETILVQKRMLRMHTKLLSTILVLWITLMMNISNLSSTCVPIHFSSMVIMAIGVVEFSREGYKIRKVFA